MTAFGTGSQQREQTPCDTSPSPVASTWVRVALLGFVLLSSTACQFAAENGEVFSGNTLGKSVQFGGTTLSPLHTISIEVLDPVTQDPFDPGSTWVILATTTPNPAPVNWNGIDLYFWNVSTVIANNNTEQDDRWLDGGLVRTRARISYGSTNLPAQVFEQFFDCAIENTGSTALELIGNCASVDYPVATLIDGDPLPAPSADYLSFKETANSAEAKDYVAAVRAGPGGNRESFAQWKTINGFPAVDEVDAVYFNKGDLGSGREMHCRQINAYEAGICGPFDNAKKRIVRTACYVSNYFETLTLPSDDPAEALALAVNGYEGGGGVKATVAMERLHFYDEKSFPRSWCKFPTSPIPSSVKNRVRFYVYGDDETAPALSEVPLDNQGPKLVPGLCLSCHGGNKNSNDATDIVGAEFLPFDVESFSYSTDAGYTLTDQYESFRELNAMVRQTAVKFPSPIVELIDGWYPSTTPGAGVLTPLALPDTNFVPSGFAGDERLYEGVIKPYCRMCHISQTEKMAFNYSPTFPVVSLAFPAFSANYMACTSQAMPHALVTQKAFWTSPARMILQNELGYFSHCASTTP